MSPYTKIITEDEISQITSLIQRSSNEVVKSKIEELKLQDNFYLSFKNEAEDYCVGYQLKNLGIEITSNANFLSIVKLVDSDADIFTVAIENCRIYAEEGNVNNHVYFKNTCDNHERSHKWKTSVSIKNTNLENISLFFQVKDTVELTNLSGSVETLEFKPLFVKRDFKTKVIEEDILNKFEINGEKLMSVKNFLAHKNIRFLKINSVQIDRTNLGDLFQPMSEDTVLHSIDFDMTSNISDPSTARSTFKRLRLLAKQLDDRIQAHIFYIKELESHAKAGNVSSDDRWLILINTILNKSGTNFRRPLILIFLFNAVILSSIFYIECSFSPEIYDFRNIVLPTHSVLLLDYSYSGWTYVLDSLRRVINSVLIFSTISAALRFRFKG